MKQILYRWSSLVIVLLTIQQAHSQTPPDAGSVRQEIEKARPLEEPKPAPPTTTPPPTTPVVPTEASVTVKSFRFSGNSLIPERELALAVAKYLDRPLPFSELQQAVSAVVDTYRQEGWIVRAFLPLQDITNGVVTVVVAEAIFGDTRLVGAAPQRIAYEKLPSMVTAQQAKGAPVSADALDHALLLINDLPGVRVTGNLAAGQKELTTDLLLKVEDGALVTGEVAVDNGGSKFTGEQRVIGTAFLNSPFHHGDQITATALYAQGVNYLQLAATVPIGNRGWRVGGHSSYLSYKLLDDSFSALDAKGSSSTVGVDASYPLIRSRTKNLNASVSLDDARFNNESNGATTTKYKIDSLSTNFNGYRFDNFGGGGLNRASLTLAYGKVNLDGSPNQLADAATTQTAGGFFKLRYLAARQQRLSERVSIYGSLSGQLASNNLNSSEKYTLGGASGVRAYSSSEGGGDEGHLANLEARVRLPFNFGLTGFYDWGQITVNHRNEFTGAATLNQYSLQGGGVTLGWQQQSLKVKATWAHRIGTNPQATANGLDQDGTLKENRFWLQASMSF